MGLPREVVESPYLQVLKKHGNVLRCTEAVEALLSAFCLEEERGSIATKILFIFLPFFPVYQKRR